MQGGLLKRRNSGSCETTGKWRALLVTFKSQAPVSSQRAPKVCQIRLLCQRETLMGTSTSIVRRKNDEKKRRKRIPKIPGNIRTNNMRAKHVFVLVYHTRKCTNHTQTTRKCKNCMQARINSQYIMNAGRQARTQQGFSSYAQRICMHACMHVGTSVRRAKAGRLDNVVLPLCRATRTGLPGTVVQTA